MTQEAISQEKLRPLLAPIIAAGETKIELREKVKIRAPQFTIRRGDFEKAFYDALEGEIVDWFTKCLPQDFENMKNVNFHESIKDGVLICKLLQLIDKNNLQKYNPQPKTAANCMDNIELFINGVKHLGVKVSFTSVDLYEQKNMKKVINSIHELGIYSNKLGILPALSTLSSSILRPKSNKKEQQRSEDYHSPRDIDSSGDDEDGNVSTERMEKENENEEIEIDANDRSRLGNEITSIENENNDNNINAAGGSGDNENKNNESELKTEVNDNKNNDNNNNRNNNNNNDDDDSSNDEGKNNNNESEVQQSNSFQVIARIKEERLLKSASWSDTLVVTRTRSPRSFLATSQHRSSTSNNSLSASCSDISTLCNNDSTIQIQNNNKEEICSSSNDDDNNNNNGENNKNGGEESEQTMTSEEPLDELQKLKLELQKEKQSREQLEKQLQETIKEKETLQNSMQSSSNNNGSTKTHRRKRRDKSNPGSLLKASLSSVSHGTLSYTSPSRSHLLSSSPSINTHRSKREKSESQMMNNEQVEAERREKEKRKQDRQERERARREKLQTSLQRQRLNVLEEILNTEQDYVEELRVICRIQNGLQGEKIISAQDATVLFSNTQQLLQVHEEIYKSLNMRITSTLSEECWNCSVGDIFTQLATFLKVYITYVGNQNAQNQMADSFLHHNRAFVAALFKYIADVENKELMTLSFHSYLIKPIQRICKYPLLLKELDKATPSDHIDKPNIEKALVQVQEIAHLINQKKKEIESMEKLLEIESNVTDLPKGFKIVVPNRRLVREGPLIKVSKGRAQERVFFLFNDIILYAATPILKGHLLFKGKIPLNLILVNDLPDQSPERKNIFELVRLDHKKKKYIICAKELKEKQEWMGDIRQIVEGFLNQSRHKEPLTPLAQLRELTEEIDRMKANPPTLISDEEEYNAKVIEYDLKLHQLNEKLALLKKNIFQNDNNENSNVAENNNNNEK
jgi:hypothetical protein